MPRYRLTLAYDGTDFLGWQVQDPKLGARTVQGVLQSALARLTNVSVVSVAGAGRTDTGVHAEGQVVSFDLERELEPTRLAGGLNRLLPADVRVLAAAFAQPDFHARRSASSKLYRYLLDTGPTQLPTRRRTVAHVPWSLDPSALEQTARLLEGRQDYASLASAGGSVSTTVRTVRRSEADYDGQTLRYEVEADGFLRKMVRSMVGGLIAAGRGASSPESLAAALAAHDRSAWPAPAQARGLTLVRVDYASFDPGLE